MARIWKERLDPSRHVEYMRGGIGGSTIIPPKDKLIVKWVYFVHVCSFTFQFTELEYITEALRYFSQKPLPSSTESAYAKARANNTTWISRSWHDKMPMYLKEEPKRQKIVKALQQAVDKFGAPP